MVGDKRNYGLLIMRIIVIALLCVFFLVPFWLILTASFTDEVTFLKGGYNFGIAKFSFNAYQYIFQEDRIWGALVNSLIVCVSFVAIAVVVNTLTAYVLSERNMPGHAFFNLLFVFTMFFHAGLVPTYLVVVGMGLYDTLMALILPGALTVYNILLIRSYFYGISPALKEAAYIDGATHLQILVKVLLPISTPIIITTALMSLVAKWNSWMDVLIYLKASSSDKWTLQYVVRQIITDFASFNADANAPTETVKSAIVLITILPLVIPFPFFQKYFQSGITLGSVKG